MSETTSHVVRNPEDFVVRNPEDFVVRNPEDFVDVIEANKATELDIILEKTSRDPDFYEEASIHYLKTHTKETFNLMDFFQLQMKILASLGLKDNNEDALKKIRDIHLYCDKNKMYEDSKFRTCFYPFILQMLGKYEFEVNGKDSPWMDYYNEAVKESKGVSASIWLDFYSYALKANNLEVARNAFYNFFSIPRAFVVSNYLWGVNQVALLDERSPVMVLEFLEKCYPGENKDFGFFKETLTSLMKEAQKQPKTHSVTHTRVAEK